MNRKSALIPIIFLLIQFPCSILAQNELIDSLQGARKNATGIEKAMIVREIIAEYIDINQDSANRYIELLESYNLRNYSKLIDGYIHKYKALIAEQQTDFEGCMVLRRIAYEKFKEVGNFSEMGWTSRGIGTLFFDLGNYDNAMEYFLLSLSAFEQDRNRRGIADIYNLLGAVNYVSGRADKALEYYNSSLELFREIEEYEILGKVYNNIGIIYYEAENYKDALRYYQDALSGFLLDNDEPSICSVYGNMSLCYFELGEMNKAMNFVHRSRSLSLKTGSLIDEISSYINLGSFQRELKQADSAIYYLKKAYEMSVESKMKPLLEETYSELAKLHAEIGEYEAAYAFQNEFMDLFVEIRNEESESRIEKLMISYEQRLKQNEIEQLTADQRTHAKINKAFGGLIILSLVSMIILVYAYTSNRKKNRLLEKKNSELTESNQKLINSQAALKRVIDDKDKLFTIIAHDLRNPVAAVSGFSELLFDNYDKLDVETIKEYISQVIQGSSRTHELLENLLLWARSQMDSISVKKTDIEIGRLINESIASIQSNINRKQITLEVSLECNFILFADFDLMKAVLRNIITNAVKFSFTGGKIGVRCFTEENKHKLAITDYGIGMEPEIMNSLFTHRSGATTPGTDGESGSGLGLIICKDYTERNGGSISVESSPNKGSTFTLSLPVKP